MKLGLWVKYLQKNTGIIIKAFPTQSSYNAAGLLKVTRKALRRSENTIVKRDTFYQKHVPPILTSTQNLLTRGSTHSPLLTMRLITLAYISPLDLRHFLKHRLYQRNVVAQA